MIYLNVARLVSDINTEHQSIGLTSGHTTNASQRGPAQA